MTALQFIQDFAFLIIGLIAIVLLMVWAEMRDDGRARRDDDPFEVARTREMTAARPPPQPPRTDGARRAPPPVSGSTPGPGTPSVRTPDRTMKSR